MHDLKYLFAEKTIIGNAIFNHTVYGTASLALGVVGAVIGFGMFLLGSIGHTREKIMGVHKGMVMAMSGALLGWGCVIGFGMSVLYNVGAIAYNSYCHWQITGQIEQVLSNLPY
jgi:hypothetical protein